MADRTIQVEFVVDAAGAITALRTADGELRQVGRTADDVGDEVRQLGVRWDDTTGRFRDARGRFVSTNQALDATERELRQVERATTDVGDRTTRLGRIYEVALGNLAANAVHLLGAAARATLRELVELAKESSALAETQSKFDTVFGESAGTVQNYVDRVGELLGLTRSQAQELLATTGAILQGAGFTEEASATASQALATLAGDLASFNNTEPAEAFEALQSALTGERERLKQFGIVINENEVQQRALQNTTKRTAAELTQQEKAAATLQLATEKAGRAVGDLARTQDSAANKARRAQAQLGNLREEMARGLAPVVADLTDALVELFDDDDVKALATATGEGLGQALQGLLNFVRDNADSFQRLGIAVGSLVAQVGNLIRALTPDDQGLIWWLDQLTRTLENLTSVLDILLLRDVGGGFRRIASNVAEANRKVADSTDELADSVARARRIIDEGLPPAVDAPAFDFGGSDVNIFNLEERRRQHKEAKDERDRQHAELLAQQNEAAAAEERARQEALKAQREAAARERDIQELRLSQMGESLERTIALLNLEFDKRVAVIREKFPEVSDELVRQTEAARAQQVAALQELNRAAFQGLTELLDPEQAVQPARQFAPLFDAAEAARINLEHDTREGLRRFSEDTVRQMTEMGQQVRAQLDAIPVSFGARVQDFAEKYGETVIAVEQQTAGVLTAIGGLLRQNAAQSEDANNRLFLAQKAVNIALAVMNTAAGVTQALKTYPPPLSFVMGGLVAAAGAIQIATIARARPGQGGSTTAPDSSQAARAANQPVSGADDEGISAFQRRRQEELAARQFERMPAEEPDRSRDFFSRDDADAARRERDAARREREQRPLQADMGVSSRAVAPVTINVDVEAPPPMVADAARQAGGDPGPASLLRAAADEIVNAVRQRLEVEIRMEQPDWVKMATNVNRANTELSDVLGERRP